jgi:uncharacterized coiled-coil protein SlyX
MKDAVDEFHMKTLEQRVERFETGLANLRDTINGDAQRYAGIATRVDRMVDQLDDLQKRFEAWKTAGNEMGKDVSDLQEVLEGHGTLLALQKDFNAHFIKTLQAHTEMLKGIAAAVGHPLPQTPTGAAPTSH